MSKRYSYLVGAVALALFTGCATRSVVELPIWIQDVPNETPNYLVFVAHGIGIANRDAERAAYGDLEVQIEARLLDYLPEATTADAEIIADVAATRVREMEAGLGPDLREVDRFGDYDEEQRRRLFLLFYFDRSSFEEDIRSIRIARTVPPAEISPDTTDGGILLEYLGLLLREEARRELPDLNEALRISRQLSLTFSPAVVETTLGGPAPPEVELAIQPPGEMTFRVRYPAGYFADPTATRFETIAVTDGDTRFALLPPEAVGTFALRIEPVWYDDAIERFGDDPLHFSEFERIGAAVTGRIPLFVESSAAEVPTAVIVVETDIASNPIPSEQTAEEITRILVSGGFDFETADLSRDLQRRLLDAGDLSVQELYDILPFELLTAVDRVVLGNAEIVNFQEGEEGILVQVTLEARVLDLRRDRTLLTTVVRGSARGNDSRAVIRGAFQNAGSQLAGQLQRRLP